MQGNPVNQNNSLSYGAGTMGNVNGVNAHHQTAYNQRVYDDLREQFFKPSNRPDLYNRIASEHLAGNGGWQQQNMDLGLGYMNQGTVCILNDRVVFFENEWPVFRTDSRILGNSKRYGSGK